MVSRAWADGCGQVAKAVGTGNNHRQRGVCVVIAEHKEEIHASNI
jgi:hypothetical protein